jgi:hypothetical protein
MEEGDVRVVGGIHQPSELELHAVLQLQTAGGFAVLAQCQCNNAPAV